MSVPQITWQDVQQAPDDGKRREAIGGELYATGVPSIRHQRISGRLTRELIRLLQDPGHGEIFHAPTGVEFPATGEGVQPDILFVSEERMGIVDPVEDADRGRKGSSMKTDESRVSVGVGAILASEGEILLMRRAQPHGQGTWSTPGGYLEPGESFEACAQREAREETGLGLEDPKFLAVTNDVFDDGRHFLTVWILGRARRRGGADVAPSEEVAEFGWFRPDDLPSPLFTPFENLVRGRGFPPPVSDAWLPSI